MPPTPETFYVALFPGFQLMDLAGPVDIFNLLVFPPFNAKISLKFVGETLDPVPTKPIPPKGTNYTYDTAGLGLNDLDTGFNQYITPEITYDALLQNVKGGTVLIDFLLIPGGLGSRLYRKHGDGSTTHTCQALMEWLPKIAPHIRSAIMTVCTGSHILAQTGLLDGRRATTNMTRFEDVSSARKQVKWEKGARWVKSLGTVGKNAGEAGRESEGKTVEIWSSAGISAGMDVALAFVTQYFGGVDVSREVARRLEYDWSEPEDGEVCKFYGRYFGV